MTGTTTATRASTEANEHAISQRRAIEFPLPDAEGRAKLIKLYARGLEVPEALLATIVQKTKGASPAFIKELMRRAAQFQVETEADGRLQQSSVDGAIEEMVFSGGTLNLKLLGGTTELEQAGRSEVGEMAFKLSQRITG